MRTVSLTGIAIRFPDDPEPEYVDIDEGTVAVVMLQENHHIARVGPDHASRRGRSRASGRGTTIRVPSPDEPRRALDAPR
jgi:hypothetical protein